MKYFLLSIVILTLFSACNEDNADTPTVFEAYGTVVLSDGISKIVLDNGKTIFPSNSSDFDMQSDTRVKVEYKINQSQTSKNNCTILKFEVIECIPYVDLYASNYDSLENDPVKINEVSLDGNCLVVNLSYGGGCRDHKIDLARIHPFCGTPPLPPPTFEIRHNSNNDLCEAWITETISFDLSALADMFNGEVKIVFIAKESDSNSYTKELIIKLD